MIIETKESSEPAQVIAANVRGSNLLFCGVESHCGEGEYAYIHKQRTLHSACPMQERL